MPTPFTARGPRGAPSSSPDPQPRSIATSGRGHPARVTMASMRRRRCQPRGGAPVRPLPPAVAGGGRAPVLRLQQVDVKPLRATSNVCPAAQMSLRSSRVRGRAHPRTVHASGGGAVGCTGVHPTWSTMRADVRAPYEFAGQRARRRPRARRARRSAPMGSHRHGAGAAVPHPRGEPAASLARSDAGGQRALHLRAPSRRRAGADAAARRSRAPRGPFVRRGVVLLAACRRRSARSLTLIEPAFGSLLPKPAPVRRGNHARRRAARRGRGSDDTSRRPRHRLGRAAAASRGLESAGLHETLDAGPDDRRFAAGRLAGQLERLRAPCHRRADAWFYRLIGEATATGIPGAAS